MKRLSGWDAMLLYSEAPNIPTHTLKVAVVDTQNVSGGFSFERFRELLARRVQVLEPLLYRLINVPLKIHHPMWLENSEVDLDYHLHRVELVGSQTRGAIDQLIGEIASEPLRRDRPLWEFTYVEGLAPNKVALIAKVHHALADGVASANLMALAVDSSPLSSAAHVGDSDIGLPSPSGTELLRAAMRDHGEQLRRLPAVVRDTAAGIARVRQRGRERGEHPQLARPFSPPPTFFNHGVSHGRRFGTATVALADAKSVSKQLGATLNDLVLAISAGALRKLMLRIDGVADRPLIASVPINTDPSPDRISGNALGALFVSLPVHIADPLERIRLTKIAANQAKENNTLLGPELVGRWTSYVPPPLAPPAFRWLSRREARNSLYNLSISNVRGPSQCGAIGGAPISEFYSVGPLTPGSGMNITVWSYVDQLNFSVLADDRSIDDADDIGTAILEDFAEIRSAIGLSGVPTTLFTAMSQVP